MKCSPPCWSFRRADRSSDQAVDQERPRAGSVDVPPPLNSEREPAHRTGQLEAKGAKQRAKEGTGKSKPAERGPHGLGGRVGFHQTQALSGSGLGVLLTTDKGFEIRHSISWATD